MRLSKQGIRPDWIRRGASRLRCAALVLSLLPGLASGAYFDKTEKENLRSRANPEQREFLVDVGSRVIAPGLQKAIPFENGRAAVYLQFKHPLSAKARGALTRSGARFYQSLSPNTYLAKIKESSLDSIARHPLVRGIEPVEAADKVTEDIFRQTVGRHAWNPDGTWSVHVRFFEDVKLPQALTAVETAGALPTQRESFLFNERLLVHGTPDQLMKLAEDSTVQSIEEIPPPPKTMNATAAQLSSVNLVQAAPYNLSGNGVRMGIWDGGPVRATHQDLTPRVTVVENAGYTGNTNHPTHVAGTMIGSGANNAAAMGMAPAAGQLFSYDFQGDPATEQNNAVANSQIRIANHSWGTVLGWEGTNNTGNTGLFGSYNGTAADWDTLVRNTGLIVVKSAGNDGNDCSPTTPGNCDGALGADGMRYDTIGTHGNAKNIITVGAINDNGTTLASFSSAGPADDGRIKPDVVANGDSLTSTCNGSDSDYCSMSGTSMSSPTVSGICALLVERYRQVYTGGNPSPDIIKALLVNTATDLGRPGPDYLFGHGLVNALAAVQLIDAGPVRIITDAVDQGDVDTYTIALPAGLPELRVTLNWIDPAGAANSGNADLVNNLDVEVVGPDKAIRYPFTGPGNAYTSPSTATGPNNVDTVEQVTIANPSSGFWTVRVRGTSVPTGPQNYALVANASFSLPDQPDIRVNAPLDFDEICPGDKQLRTVSIFNIGGADLEVSSVSVIAGTADFSVLPNPTQPFIVKPGEHIDVTVKFSPTFAGVKAGTLRIVSNDADQGTFDFAMTGEGGYPAIDTFMANSGDFGDVCRNTLKDLPLTIVNSGSCALTVSNITSSSPQFVVPTVVNFPLVIGPGTGLQVPIRFQPTTLGPKTAVITVFSTDPAIPTRPIFVSGSVPPGDIRITGSTDFGDVCAGTVGERVIEICNAGKCDLTVTNVALVGQCPDFTIVNNPFPAVVGPGACIAVTIRFTPTSCGAKSCSLEILSDDPDMPQITLPVKAEAPCPSIDVPPDLGFEPEVIQSAGSCSTLLPFPISNKGKCNLVITEIAIAGANATDFSLSGLPSFPIILEPGHIAGEGDLRVVFAPTAVARERRATISVTYVSDPVTGSTTTVTRDLCGEGVLTGARVLVMSGGIPMAHVEKIQLQRINANRNRDQLDTQDVAQNLALVTETPAPPCEPFQYHREYGTVSNPIQLLPGAYQVTVSAIVNGKRKSKSVGFDVSTCDFNPTVVVNF